MFPKDVLEAWNAFEKAYDLFKEEWDAKNSEYARILDEFFEQVEEQEKKDKEHKSDPADWWKRD
jgi:hypothetical protein